MECLGGLDMSLLVKEFEKIRGIDVFYKEHKEFEKIFSDREIHLCGHRLVIDNKIINGMYERFMHAVSCENRIFKDKDYPPCNNEMSSEQCVILCNLDMASFEFKKISRVECLYRLSRISWIKEVLDMANQDDHRVQVWRYEKRDGTNGKFQWKWYVRYKERGKDFLIVFREDKNSEGEKVLNFRTAYPLYLPGDKRKIEKEYNRAKKDNNVMKNKKPAFV